MSRTFRIVSSNKRRLTLFGVIVVALAATLGAVAYFTSVGSGTATPATAGTMTAATISTPAISSSPVTITWTAQAAMTPSSQNSNITYTVMRKPAAGAYAAVATGPCSGSLPYPTTSCADSSVPSDGTYKYEVVAHFHSWTATSNEVSVAVDATPPTVSVTFPADSGNYNASGWTNGGTSPCGATGRICGQATDAMSGISGASALSLTITQSSTGFTWNGSSFASGTNTVQASSYNSGTGLWTYLFPNTNFPADGTYTVKASATDVAGNTGTSSTNTFKYDTTNPSVTVSFPASGAFYNASGWAAGAPISGTATDATSGIAGASSIQITITQSSTGKTWNGTSFATGSNTVTPTTFASGTWTYTFPNSNFPADGTYTVSASATDRANNTGTSATNSFVYDTVSPTVTLANPANNSFTNQTAPTFSGTAGQVPASASASADSTTVTVFICTGSQVSCNALSPTLTQTRTTTEVLGSWSVPASPALTANAQYTAQAAQSDGAGNTGTSSANTFVIDTVAPAPTIGATTPSAFVNSTTPTISGTAGSQAADATHSADNTTVTVKIFSGPTTGGTLLQTFTPTVSGGNWTVTPAALTANAQYTVQVTQADGAGNSGSATKTFVIDTVNPVVTLATPTNNSFTNSTTPTFSGTAGQVAASTTASTDSTTVTVYICTGSVASCNAGSGTLTRTLTATQSGGNWSVAPGTPLTANAQYTAQAAQSDGAGNTGTSSANTFVIDTVAPTPTIGATTPSAFVNTTTPTLSGTAGTQAADATHSADNTTVLVDIFAGATATGTPVESFSPTVSGGTWTVTPSPALTANAQYTLRVTQGDGAGNSGNATKTFVIDTVAPSVAVTQVNGSTVSFPYSTNVNVTSIGGTCGNQAADATHSTDSATVSWTFSTQSGTAACTGGTWTSGAFGTAISAEGTYSAQASQTDGAGNTGSDTKTVIIDKTAPVVTLTKVNGSTVTFAFTSLTSVTTIGGACGTASGDSTTVSWSVTGTSSQSGTATCTAGSWTATLTSALGDGSYTLSATQTDAAGNTGTSGNQSLTVNVAVDFNAVSTLANNQVWAVGSKCAVYFYNGTTWTRDNNVPATCVSNKINLTGVALISSTEAYIAGSNTLSNATFLTCSAACTSATATWTARTIPAGESNSTVTGLSTGVTKDVLVTANDSSGGMIWGCDGSAPCNTLTNVPPGTHLANVTFNAVSMIENNGHALAVGSSAGSAYMEECSANCTLGTATWAKVTTLPAAATGPLTGVVQDDNASAIAVGQTGTGGGIVLGCSNNCLTPTGTWAQETGISFAGGVTPTQVASFKGGGQKNAALIVGTQGKIWYCPSTGATGACFVAGAVWNAQTSGTSNDLLGVDGIASGANFGFSVAVGRAATVVVAATSPPTGWSASTLDTVAPAAPTGPVTLANGQGVGNAYINNSTKTSVSVSVAGIQEISASNSVVVTLSDGTTTVTGSAAANSGTVTVTGINASTLVDGTNNITISAIEEDAQGNDSGPPTSAATNYSKDTAAPTVSAVAIANKTGGTAGLAEPGDTITVTYSAVLHIPTICSTWATSDTTSGTLTSNATVTLTKGTNDSLSFSSTDCTLNFGSIAINGTGYTNGASGNTVTFAGSTVAWDGSSKITITLGSTVGGTTTALTNNTNHVGTYTPNAAITDPAANPISGTGATTNTKLF